MLELWVGGGFDGREGDSDADNKAEENKNVIHHSCLHALVLCTFIHVKTQ